MIYAVFILDWFDMRPLINFGIHELEEQFDAKKHDPATPHGNACARFFHEKRWRGAGRLVQVFPQPARWPVRMFRSKRSHAWGD